MIEVLDEISKPKKQKIFFGVCSIVLLTISLFLMIKVHLGLLEIEGMATASEQNQYDKGYKQAKFLASAQNSILVTYLFGFLSIIFCVISFFRKEKRKYLYLSLIMIIVIVSYTVVALSM